MKSYNNGNGRAESTRELIKKGLESIEAGEEGVIHDFAVMAILEVREGDPVLADKMQANFDNGSLEERKEMARLGTVWYEKLAKHFEETDEVLTNVYMHTTAADMLDKKTQESKEKDK